MAEQIRKQPQEGRKPYDSDNLSEPPLTPSGKHYSSRPSSSVSSEHVGKTVSNIDDVLNENAAPASGVGAPSLFQPSVTQPTNAGKAATPETLKKNESGKGGLNKPEGGIGKENDLGTDKKRMSRRRKIMMAGGGGGLTGLLIALAIVIPMEQLPSIMQLIEHKAGIEIEHVLQKRATRFMADFLVKKALNQTDSWATSSSPAGKLVRQFVAPHFIGGQDVEHMVLAKTGLFFQEAKDGRVDVHYWKSDLGEVRNSDDLISLLEGNTVQTYFGGKAGTASISLDDAEAWNTIVQSVIHADRASTFADLLRSWLPNRNFAPPEESKSANASEAEAADTKAIDQQLMDTTNPTDIEAALDCIVNGNNCDKFQQEDPNSSLQTDPNVTSEAAGAGEGVTQVDSAITEATTQAESEVAQNADTDFIQSFEDILTNEIAKLLGSDVADLPVGIINAASQVVEVLNNIQADSLLNKIPELLKSDQYAALYARVAGYASEDLAGKLPATMNKVVMSHFGSTFDESSSAKYIEGESVTQAETGVLVSPKVDSNAADQAQATINDVVGNPAMKVLMAPLQFWYNTVGKLLNTIIGKIVNTVGGFFDYVLNQSGFTNLFKTALQRVFGQDWKKQFAAFTMKLIMTIMGAVVDPLAHNAAFFNNVFTGAEVASNSFCENQLGCEFSNPNTTATLNIQLQQEQDKQLAMMPLSERLFSMKVPNSFINNLIVAAPINDKPSSIMASVFSAITKVPESVMAAFSPKLQAFSLQGAGQITGVGQYFISDQDLAQEVAPQVLQQPDGSVTCPKTTPINQVNLCITDSTVIKGLNCWVGGPCPPYQEQ